MTMQTRHDLPQTAALGTVGSATSTSTPATKHKHTLCAFTKQLQGLSFDQISDIAAELGLDGIEATVRPGGHVEPERVADEFPKLSAALKRNNLEITILTSAITQVSTAQNTEQMLRTAKALGIKRYRMGYLKYDLDQPIQTQLDEWKPSLKHLITLSAEIGIQPLLHNHSGWDFFGGPIWDAWSLMKDYTPQEWGFTLDAYHTAAEAGTSWPIDTSVIQTHIQALHLNDMKWRPNGTPQGVPLGTGMVSKDFAPTILRRGFNGPICLHTEYMKGDGSDPDFVKATIAPYKRDLAVIKEWIARAC